MIRLTAFELIQEHLHWVKGSKSTYSGGASNGITTLNFTVTLRDTQTTPHRWQARAEFANIEVNELADEFDGTHAVGAAETAEDALRKLADNLRRVADALEKVSTYNNVEFPPPIFPPLAPEEDAQAEAEPTPTSKKKARRTKQSETGQGR